MPMPLVGSKLPDMVKVALSRDPDAARRLARKLTGRMDDRSVAFVADAARALEPVLTRAQQSRPSRLTELGLKGTGVLRALADDGGETGPLSRLVGAKTIGIAFVDIVDFTTFTATHGDDEAIVLLARAGELVDRAVAVGKGVCVKRLGDGFLLAFPSPSQAVRAALALTRSSERDGIHLRIAVHAGHPTVERDDLLGHDVNLAAHLLESCPPGEILVTDEAKTRAERRLRSVVFANRRSIRVRGVDTSILVHTPAQKSRR
jgi:class 3 adenylate cyclase